MRPLRLRWRRVLTLAIAATPLVIGAAGWGHEGPHEGGAHQASAEEKAAYEAAKPIFVKHCARCHTRAGDKAKAKSLKHFSMDTYPFSGHHAKDVGAAVRNVLVGKGGMPPTMPDDDPGAVKGDDLKKILAWSDAFDHAQTKGGHTIHE